jgi:hypothetical protein
MMLLFVATTFLSFAALTYGNGVFYDAENCNGETFKTGVGLRQYTAWTEIEAGKWVKSYRTQYECEHTSSTINGKYFSRPTRCVDGGLYIRAEFDVPEKSCSVDHSWLFEKIGKATGKDFKCEPSSDSDGCTTGVYAESYNSNYSLDDWKNFMNGACVVHDICYTIPSTFGITKDTCDNLVRDLSRDRCQAETHPECKLPDKYFKKELSRSSYEKAQKKKTPCSLTVRQRQSSLYQGSQMNTGAKRWSPNGRYVLTLEEDGNLVIYRKPSNEAVWSSQTRGIGVVKALMQFDGNFVLYTVDNEARWHTGTDMKPINHLLLQNDGNLVIYNMGYPTSMWESKDHGGYLIPLSTNLRTESLNSTSNDEIGTMMMQEDLSDTPVDIVQFDRDPNSAGTFTGASGAPGQASDRTVDGA